MVDNESEKIAQINLREVLGTRLPRYSRFIPGFVVRWMERVIHQDGLNKILRDIGHSDGVTAADISLSDLGVDYRAIGLDRIPGEGRFIFASNHPLGGLDGLALISLLGHHYDGNIRFIVNDLLMAVKPLRSVFLPVNKHGSQSRMSVEQIEAEYESDRQMLTFPAGLCSRRMKGGEIADLEWKKFVVTSAVKYQRDVIPVFVDAQNSSFFYRVARLREKLGLKFNLEMVYLPGEMFKMKGKTLDIHFGEPVKWESLQGVDARTAAAQLRDETYAIKGRYAKT